MVINVLDLVPHCYTWEDGAVVGKAIRQALNDEGGLTVSFNGVTDVPTSFVNAAFVSLLDDFPYEQLRARLSIINSTRHINDMIKRRFEFESKREKTVT